MLLSPPLATPLQAILAVGIQPLLAHVHVVDKRTQVFRCYLVLVYIRVSSIVLLELLVVVEAVIVIIIVLIVVLVLEVVIVYFYLLYYY